MKKILLLCTAGLATAGALADEVRVVSEITAANGSNSHYPTNKAPLEPSPLVQLPIGSITPAGWLLTELKLEANGMGGRLAEISPFLKYADNGWVKPDGKSGWEELPYFLKGYGDLGYVVGDKRILDDTHHWIDGILALQADDGWFGPAPLRKAIEGRPDMWPHMPILNALQSFYDVSGDSRVIPFMTKYFRWQSTLPGEYFSRSWQDTRFGDNIESIYWLYNRTGEAWLLDLAKSMHEHSAKWSKDVINWHNVNFSQGFREPAEVWQQLKDPALLKATERNYDKAMFIYGQFAGGGFAADENARAGYTSPRQGFETCGMVEFMHSFEMLDKITGAPIWSDRCEDIAFNSLPAALTPDLKALHYLTAPNQVQLDHGNKAPDIDNHGTMFSYSPGQVYRCCQHNHLMGWPYYAEHLWLGTADDGLCAALYSASDVAATVGAGKGEKVKIVEATDYPFRDTVQFKISAAQPVSFPLYLRVPGWCETPAVQLNGSDLATPGAKSLSFIVINRTWKDGDALTLKLPMKIAVKTWEKNDNAVSVNYGPLSFSLAIGTRSTRYGGSDQWPETEVYPTTAWNYGLELDRQDPAKSFKVVQAPVQNDAQPFTPEASPVHLEVAARKIPAWKTDRLGVVGFLKPSPIRSAEPVETVSLIPMGAARLRISSFPTVSDSPEAHEWPEPKAADAELSASFEHDSIDALNDGILPAKSSDETIPRFTWWDHKGSSEWVQYTFKNARTLSAAEVYWFDDTGKGRCRVPKSWRLLYKDGGEWKPVPGVSSYPVALDQFNRVEFPKLTVKELRLEVALQDGFSGGVLEWRVHE